MKLHLKQFYTLLLFLTSIFLVGCGSGDGDGGGGGSETNQLVSIQIIPTTITTRGVSDLSIAKGNSQAFTAMGTYSDGTTADITNSVAWSSDNTQVVSIHTNGVATAIEAGTTTVSALKGDITSNAVNLSVTTAVLDSIQITPASLSLAKGNFEALTAMGTYSDGTTADITNSVTWSSDNTQVVSISTNGVATAIDASTTMVSALKDGITSNVVNLSVTTAVLDSIQITPADLSLVKGNYQALTAMGTYSDGTTADITNNVTWSSDNTQVVSISTNGMVTAINAGTTTVSALKDGITSNVASLSVTIAVLDSIQITPASLSLAKGNSQALTAMGTYSDGTTVDITNSVAWSSDNIEVVSISSNGVVTATDTSTTTVSALKDGIISNVINISATTAVLDSIQITPATLSLAKGNFQALTAMGTYSDGTTADITNSVAWSSDNIEVVSINSKGVATAIDAGMTTISALKDDITSNVASLSVTTAVLDSIQITPTYLSLAKGNSQALTAMGTYSDGTTADITNSVAWNSGNTQSATVSATGLVTAIDTGTTMISALKDDITSNAVNLSVTTAVLDSIQITPVTLSLAKGNSQALAAMGTYSDGTTVDITNSVAWNSRDTQLVTVNSSGLATAIDEGTTTVSALKDGITSNVVNLSMTTAVLYDIQITPETLSLVKGGSQALTAMGLYSDGTTANITNSVAWNSGDTHLATVSASGLVTAIDTGTTAISSLKDGITSNTVDMDIIVSIDICGGIVNDTTLFNALVDNNCLKVIQTNNGSLYTSPPTTNIMNYLGYVKDGHPLNPHKTYDSSQFEDGSDGPNGWTFARFNIESSYGYPSVELSQYAYWCHDLNSMKFAGKSNWAVASLDELSLIFSELGNMHELFDWPTGTSYWSNTPISPNHSNIERMYLRSLKIDFIYPQVYGVSGYTSCISK